MQTVPRPPARRAKNPPGRSESPASGTLARGLNNLGWHWWPSDSAIASVDYEGRAKCINLGHRTSGCAQGAKASTDMTYWPAAIRRRRAAHALPGARDHHQRTRHGVWVVYYDPDGRSFSAYDLQ
jgi:hypothetical protein